MKIIHIQSGPSRTTADGRVIAPTLCNAPGISILDTLSSEATPGTPAREGYPGATFPYCCNACHDVWETR